MKFLSALIVISFLTLSLLIPDIQAQAKKNGSITVSPAYLEVTLSKPGEEQKIPITYTNNSNQTVTMQMFPLDFNHTDVNGTIGFLTQPGSYSYALASYLSLEASQITLNPGQSHKFTVRVTNRPDLSPGGHYAAIVGKVIAGQNPEFGAQVAPSLSSLIFLRKTGGERYNLSLKPADGGQSVSFFYPDDITLQFQNEGNIHLVPYGTVEVTDMFGRVLRRGILNTSSFLVMPESRRNITVDIRGELFSYPISVNTLTVKGNDSLKKTTFLYRNTFLYINPLLVGGLVVLIAGGYFLKKRIKHRKNKSEQ
jgi:hypothetical protein